MTRVKVREKVSDEISLYDRYDVPSGERPEDTSFKHFGSATYHWVILLTNNITDAYYGWPMSYADFERYMNETYTNPEGIHHYEITQSSGVTSSLDNSHLIEVNSDTSGASSVSNREFEQRIQDNKRLIKILRPEYLSEFIEEFKRTIQR